MKKVETVVRAKMWNDLDDPKILAGRKVPLEVEALVDTGARRVVIPGSLVEALRLRPAGFVRVRYADGRTARKRLAGGLRVEVAGRRGTFDAIVEPKASRVLLGHFFLELLDFVVDAPTGKLKGRHGKEPLEHAYAACA